MERGLLQPQLARIRQQHSLQAWVQIPVTLAKGSGSSVTGADRGLWGGLSKQPWEGGWGLPGLSGSAHLPRVRSLRPLQPLLSWGPSDAFLLWVPHTRARTHVCSVTRAHGPTLPHHPCSHVNTHTCVHTRVHTHTRRRALALVASVAGCPLAPSSGAGHPESPSAHFQTVCPCGLPTSGALGGGGRPG